MPMCPCTGMMTPSAKSVSRISAVPWDAFTGALCSSGFLQHHSRRSRQQARERCVWRMTAVIVLLLLVLRRRRRRRRRRNSLQLLKQTERRVQGCCCCGRMKSWGCILQLAHLAAKHRDRHQACNGTIKYSLSRLGASELPCASQDCSHV